ncbi:acyl-[acyl-carrier-protein]--UDP-N-acetylglucosamine O-acyltransferase [Rahnella sp. AA]|uniref:acyl-ACP--UDP-N-acetylglucosamine O-acyltransferase n=1 Tax=Rahnella sp. AA TaxID=2057180 RepID=UPI000C31E0A5|nr:acyl-ACP--UDP-N-acetylglucosamine O-acyltransferase [Rahnella sp. AA]PKE28856.1 acyl-[acyl-carrier-protein]--UDP-N-acetylglucosamine O-acyltransferase [Rahnella sp. AA]
MLISSSATIAASSIVEPGALIGAHVVIGPFCIISASVQIGEGTIISPHVVINGNTKIGTKNQIGMGSSIGEISQDLKYAGEPSGLVIGDGNRIGCHTTLHRGTEQGGGMTRIGNLNVFERGVHIGHDCQVGNEVFMGEHSGLAGHVGVGDFSHIAALCAIHQYCVVGAGTRLLQRSGVVQDVPPFVLAEGNHAQPKGINEQSAGYLGADAAQRAAIHHLYDLIYHQQAVKEQVMEETTRLCVEYPLLRHFSEFFLRSARGIIR